MEDKGKTLYCGNLHEKVTEDLLYELFLQAGPLESVTIPKDKDGRQRNFGFIKFKHAVSVPYSLALMDGTSLYGRTLKLDPRTGYETPPNPYTEQLKQYEMQSYQNDRRNNDRFRGHDSRRSRTDNYRNQQNLPQPNITGFYPGFIQPDIPMNLMPGTVYPPRYGMYPNQWQGYR